MAQATITDINNISKDSSYSEEYKLVFNHPYTQSLLKTGNYEIEHPYDVPEEQSHYSLTAGTLAGTNMIAHTPLTLVNKQSPVPDSSSAESGEEVLREIIVLYHLGGKLCGHPGLIHGGLLATLMDESLCRCAFPCLPNKLGVTASLNIKYLSPTPAQSIVALRAVCVKVDGRKATVKGTISVLEEKEGEPFSLRNSVSGEALVIEPRWVKKIDTGHFSQTNSPAESATVTPAASKPSSPPATD